MEMGKRRIEMREIDRKYGRILDYLI